MSKLDDAFLKAYAKVRDAGSRDHADTPPIADDQINDEIWTDSDGDHLLRPDDGVVNVASFIARTAHGRTRGTARRPSGSTPVGTHPHETPSPHGVPDSEDDDQVTHLIDRGHALRGPHFQPIALDLAALDIFAPVAAVAVAYGSLSTMDVSPQGDDDGGEISRPRIAESTRDGSSGFQPRTESRQPAAKLRVPATVAAKPQTSASGWPSNLVAASAAAPAAAPAVDRPNPLVRDSMNDRPEIAETPNVADAAVENLIIDEIATDDATFDQPAFEQSTFVSRDDSIATGATADGAVLRADAGHVNQAVPTDSNRASVEAPQFVAAWEVDRFEFEDIVWDLSDEKSALWHAAEQLEIACQEGLKVLAITSPSRDQGRSTLAITLARMLAATGLNVALLDGDLDRPSLADKMRLEIRLGWADAVRTGLSAEEVAVQSVEDGFTVLPAATPDTPKAARPAREATATMIDQLRDAFDLVVIDTANVNVIGGWIPGAEQNQIDAALVIQDLRSDDPDAMQACLRRLQKIGIANIGLVENFAS
jgi:Mrp family chromosome partitioning ATPase